MERFPLAERLLLDSPALSWIPGQTPTHEASWAADGNAAARGPISAMICCAESIPRPGSQAHDCILMRFHRLCNHFVQACHL
jgi:hypothetical protein